MQHAAHLEQVHERRRHAVQQVEAQRAIELGVGERQQADVGAPEAHAVERQIGDLHRAAVEDEPLATHRIGRALLAADLLGEAQHAEVQVYANGEIAGALSKLKVARPTEQPRSTHTPRGALGSKSSAAWTRVA